MEDEIQKELGFYDSLFEWVLLLLTFVEATFYQYFTWLSNPTKNVHLYRVITATISIVFPFLFTLIPLILGILISKYNLILGLKFRVFSQGALFIVFIYIMWQMFAVVSSLKYLIPLNWLVIGLIGCMILITPMLISVVFFKTFNDKFLVAYKFSRKKDYTYLIVFLAGIIVPFIIMIGIQISFGMYST